MPYLDSALQRKERPGGGGNPEEWFQFLAVKADRGAENCTAHETSSLRGLNPQQGTFAGEVVDMASEEMIF